VPSYKYERLSAQDSTFLIGERPTSHMHVTGVEIFESGALRTQDGGVDFDLIRRGVRALLHLVEKAFEEVAGAFGVEVGKGQGEAG
jgi:hypothetical protein